ncbi:MAG: hypothetical protein R3C56_36570 [Pirellulaceae bacterium]
MRTQLISLMWIIRLATVPALLAGCHGPHVCCDPSFVSKQLQCRIGIQPEVVAPCRQVIPAGVVLEDGLSEDEAVQTALTNNSTFQATLAAAGNGRRRCCASEFDRQPASADLFSVG